MKSHISFKSMALAMFLLMATTTTRTAVVDASIQRPTNAATAFLKNNNRAKQQTQINKGKGHGQENKRGKQSLAFHGGSQAQGGGTATMSTEIFNLVKSIVGAGVLSLPAGIAAFGDAPSAVIPASLLIAVIGSISGEFVGYVCTV